MAREGTQAAIARWDQLHVLQVHYKEFLTFAEDVMDFLGFGVTDLQADIAEYMAAGGQYIMIQAQRGQAKTTLAAAFAVYTLIHNPKARILIVSAGETQANEISTLIVRLIGMMDEIECLRPDKRAGDRTSVEAFDVHHSLKGVDKSPSVACVGVTGNLAGKRADLLIADDIESKKNSRTAGQRLQLIDQTREFIDLCSTGRIMYLGTPQSMESVYNTLPSRGFDVRIWTGRYPTQTQLANYGELLAPFIRNALAADPKLQSGGGVLRDQGQATDPAVLGDSALISKEHDKGPSDFQLQYMLNTRISDAGRFPLKTKNLVVMRLARDLLPMTVARAYSSADQKSFSVHGHGFSMSLPHSSSEELRAPEGVIMYVDPAGGGANGDETAYAVTAVLNGNIFLLAVGGVPGGYSIDSMTELAKVAVQWRVDDVAIEKNFGYGAFKEVWMPVLRAQGYVGGVSEDYVTTQKEIRIIETLEPILGRGALVVNESIIEAEEESLQRYDAGKRCLYSFFFQMNKITHDRKSLIHDDRLDAVEGAVRKWVHVLYKDQEAEEQRQRAAELTKFFQDPCGHNRYKGLGTSRPTASSLDRFRRIK